MTLNEIIETHRDLCGSIIAYAKEKLSRTSIENPKGINYEYSVGIYDNLTISEVFMHDGSICFRYDDEDEYSYNYFDELSTGMQIDIISEL
jgi:DNA integrity scanning protein DisA with diadenylate cyclase activity